MLVPVLLIVWNEPSGSQAAILQLHCVETFLNLGWRIISHEEKYFNWSEQVSHLSRFWKGHLLLLWDSFRLPFPILLPHPPWQPLWFMAPFSDSCNVLTTRTPSYWVGVLFDIFLTNFHVSPSYHSFIASWSLLVHCILRKYLKQFCSMYLEWHSQHPCRKDGLH